LRVPNLIFSPELTSVKVILHAFYYPPSDNGLDDGKHGLISSSAKYFNFFKCD